MRKVVIVFVMLAGCNNSPAAPVFSYDKRDAEITILKNEVDSLQKQMLEVRVKANAHTWASLRTNEDGYSLIDAGGMPLTISLGDVKESASGSRVQLRIGNPSTANITRLHLWLSYGKSTSGGLLTNPSHDKEERITTPLLAGKWTDVTVGLPDAPPKEIGIIRINSALVEELALTEQARSTSPGE